ncbi:MAG: extracellular solute-binding protein [Chloroflexi bacterium]|nr:extracellular solute-binding protein [Chloroflexota bacterium]
MVRVADQAAIGRRVVLHQCALALSGLAVLPLLAACGSSTAAVTATASTTVSSVSSATHAASTTASSASTAAATSPVGAGGKVTWVVWEDPLIDKYARVVIPPAFEKRYPGTTVEVITPGSAGYGQKLLALFAAGTVPEVFSDGGGFTNIWTLWKKQMVTVLSPYLQQAKINPDFLLPVYHQEYSHNGQLFAMPWNSNPNFLVYNKTLFQKYNVPLPPADWNDQSWTTEKLLETAKALTHLTNNPSTTTYGLIMGAGTFGTLGWLWNADPFNDKGGPQASAVYQGKPYTQVYIDRSGMLEAMTWLADLTLKYHVSPTPSDAQALSSQGNPIFSGRVGIVEVAAGWLERQAAVAKPHFSWAIAPFPWGPGKSNVAQREDNAWYLGKGSKNPQGGFDLIMFISRGQGADDLVEYVKDNPPLTNPMYFQKWSQNIAKIPGFAMPIKDFQNIFEGGIKRDFPDPQNVIYEAAEFMNSFSQLMAPVWIGKQTPLAGLQAVQAKWQGIVKSLQGQ